jgi:hypothetical protein
VNVLGTNRERRTEFFGSEDKRRSSGVDDVNVLGTNRERRTEFFGSEDKRRSSGVDGVNVLGTNRERRTQCSFLLRIRPTGTTREETNQDRPCK